jgi:hypothetical protein
MATDYRDPDFPIYLFCITCDQVLDVDRDMQTSTGEYYKNCQACRDKNTFRKSRSTASRRSRPMSESLLSITSTVTPESFANDPDNNLWECSVCGDVFPPNAFPRLDACIHENDVCEGCFEHWLTSQVNDANWDRVVCPTQGCNNIVTHSDMHRLAAPETCAR